MDLRYFDIDVGVTPHDQTGVKWNERRVVYTATLTLAGMWLDERPA